MKKITYIQIYVRHSPNTCESISHHSQLYNTSFLLYSQTGALFSKPQLTVGILGISHIHKHKITLHPLYHVLNANTIRAFNVRNVEAVKAVEAKNTS